jgi:hypothetical protein
MPTVDEVKNTIAKFYGANWLFYVIKQGGWQRHHLGPRGGISTHIDIEDMTISVNQLNGDIWVIIEQAQQGPLELQVKTTEDLAAVTGLLKSCAMARYQK